MLIFPAIDLYKGKAVRLLKGDYSQMTVYSDDPVSVAADFEKAGASCLHIVDLEGAKSGLTPNLDTIRSIVEKTELFTEVGGGIRSMGAIDTYIRAGVGRVILGTAAVTEPDFAAEAVARYGERIAVGVDIRDGRVSIKGWTEDSGLEAMDFCRKMQELGIKTLICTDISRDGAMRGANHSLYRELSRTLGLDIVASGGVSSMEDVKRLRALDLCGAIIGRACYNGAIDLKEAIEVAK